MINIINLGQMTFWPIAFWPNGVEPLFHLLLRIDWLCIFGILAKDCVIFNVLE